MKKYIFVFLLIIIRACICAEPTKQQNCPSIQYCDDTLGYPPPVMIHFPFRLKSQPQVCGYDQQGFELSCQGNNTIINLPYSSEEPFWVNDIDYQAQRLSVRYPGACIARSSFREPNISTSPFRRIYQPVDTQRRRVRQLPNGVPIAVKVLEDPTVNGEEFVNEVGTIGMIHHVNVVRLFGYCVEGSKRALIYEFMPNESLEKYIFAQDDRSTVLSWPKLQEIAMGIARGMEYLHQGCDRRILHFDIKPHNILLDHKFTPKISDFGLAKLCSKEMSIVSMTAVRGTVGYIAPEVYLRNSNMVSHKSDVYSFGMLLLEMVGGRRIDDDGAAAQIYFPEWIYLRLAGGEGLGLRTEGEEDVEIAKRLTATSLWCIQWNPVDRPSMGVAVQMLEGGAESFSLPPNPFTS